MSSILSLMSVKKSKKGIHKNFIVVEIPIFYLMKDEIFSMGRQSGLQMSKTVHGFLILETFEQFDLDPVMDKLWSVLNNFDLFGTEHYETAFIYFNFVIDFELDYKDTYEDIQACFNINSPFD